jgi:hypothetical protein
MAESAGRTWPTDHLLDVYRRLERLWHTLTGVGDWAEMNEERAAILFAVSDGLARAADSAGQLTPPADMAAFTTLAQRVGCLRDDLVDGVAVADLIGSGSYAARIEESIEETAAAWETAEWASGRPRITHDQAVADITERPPRGSGPRLRPGSWHR